VSYDEIADGYARHWGPVIRPAAERVLDLAATTIEADLAAGRPPHLLDVGAGTGALAIRALERWPELHVTASDPAGGMLELARAHAAERLPVAVRRQVQAAIAALHDAATTPGATDWAQIAALYGRLANLAPSPVVELNRAVAIAMAEGPAAGLELLDGLADERLATYQYFHSARADLLRRLGRRPTAAEAYRRAIELTSNEIERAFLTRRLAEVEGETARPN